MAKVELSFHLFFLKQQELNVVHEVISTGLYFGHTEKKQLQINCSSTDVI